MKASRFATIDLARIAIVAAMYAVLTVALGFMSYQGIQFRVAEILMLLCFYDYRYCPALILGCFVANLFSPFGVVDWVFGTLATALAAICMRKSPNIYVAAAMPVIFNAVIIGLEIFIFFGSASLATWANLSELLVLFGTIGFGEFVVVCLVGVPLMLALERNHSLRQNVFFLPPLVLPSPPEEGASAQ